MQPLWPRPRRVFWLSILPFCPGIRCSVCCALGAALPSFIIILLIALFFHNFKENPIVQRVFLGIRPAVVALIAVPVFRLAKTAGITYKTAWLPAVSALLVWLLGVSPVYVVLAAGLGGFLYGRVHGGAK